jgi:phosphomannomutase
MVKEKIPLGNTTFDEVIKRVAAHFSAEQRDDQDGLKIIRADGWVHLRPSNTEPIMRCYAEARTESAAHELARGVLEVIDNA